MVTERLRRLCPAQEGAMEWPRADEVAGSQRRRHPRFIVAALGVTIAVRSLLGAEQVRARLINVSLGGCCIALPAAQAQTLVESGACRCALPVGIARYPIDYTAAVVGWRGRYPDREHYVHLCFNRVSPHQSTLLARWIATLPAACAW
jgi:c-di-GMP-binding flagellar brake protein YcgR